MDQETRDALELTKEELLAKRDAAEPGVVAKRPRDLNQRAKAIVDQAMARDAARDAATVRFRVVASSTVADTVTKCDEAFTSGPILERVSQVEYRVG